MVGAVTYVRKRFSSLLEKTVTLREFAPGEYAEVDYAGSTVEWLTADGEIHDAQVFIGILCYSQRIFAHSTENQRKDNWLRSHCKMFEELSGVPRVIVPDNLKSGVTRTHLYDPDLNPDYTELARHYGIAIVPARVRRPKDKALVEGAVKLVMRLFQWTYRRHTFTSILEINKALRATAAVINQKKHTRFKCSRMERFETDEKAHLKALPLEPWEGSYWKLSVLHSDCTVAIDRNFYSAPYTLRGKTLRVKMTTSRIEIFHDMERVALHPRVALGKVGHRVLDLSHLPANSRAYLEVTPQNLLSQSKFIHPKLHEVIEILFEKDVLGNLRRAQGLIRKAHSVVQLYGHAVASEWIVQAADHMIRFNNIRVKLFDDLIKAEQKKIKPQEDRTIVRKPGNPMLRRVRGGMSVVVPSIHNHSIKNRTDQMSLTQVRHVMSELCLYGMLNQIDEITAKVQAGELSFIEGVDFLSQAEKQHRTRKAMQGRISRSKIRRGASLEDFDLTKGRQVAKTQLKELETLHWCDEGRPLILVGPTGVGKTYLARALGLRACEAGKAVLFMTVTEFLENQALVRSSGTYLRFREKLIRPDLLILDDIGMRKFSSQEAEDLRDVIEQRSYGKSTLFTTQLPIEHWGEVIGDEIILDALFDRLEPPGIVMKMTGESYRKNLKQNKTIETSH